MRATGGTADFERYVQNLQRAMLSASIGSQLSGKSGIDGRRPAMIHNPYVATVADMGICRLRDSTRTKAVGL